MANKRDFKKDVNGVFATVIEECVFTADFFPEKAELAGSLIEEAIALYDETMSARKLDDKMSAKAFYSGLINNYVAKMSDILTRLNEK